MPKKVQEERERLRAELEHMADLDQRVTVEWRLLEHKARNLLSARDMIATARGRLLERLSHVERGLASGAPVAAIAAVEGVEAGAVAWHALASGVAH